MGRHCKEKIIIPNLIVSFEGTVANPNGYVHRALNKSGWELRRDAHLEAG